jgi:mycothiol synthase
MQLVMRRDLSEPMPELPRLPRGYELRVADPEDAREIAWVLTAAFSDPWSEERVFQVLLGAPDVRRTYVIEFGRSVVATASAQVLPERWPDSGVVHWVGADPAHAGRGLGHAVCLAVLHDHREAGHRDVVLTTDDERLAAIRTYWKLGFRPLECDPTHPERWSRVLEQIGVAAVG